MPVDASTRVHVEHSDSRSKFTFYFSQSQLDRLDDMWSTVRKKTRGRKTKISKSSIVGHALEQLLEKLKRIQSGFWRKLREHAAEV